ncbi:hypothetical protein [Haloarcula sp. CGMCC 1.6347]|uniref:hypothetical protein n=1 Tax=Haloarcula sp. CGMCC 1.6347 TaxID=3111455 RepID=UPI00300EA35A
MLDNFDPLQVLTTMLAYLFALTGVVANGVGTFSIEGVNIGMTLVSMGGQALTLAPMLAIVSLVGAYLLNNRDFSDFNDLQTYIAGIGIVLVLGTALVPAMTAFVMGTAFVGWIVLLIEAVSFSIVAGYWNGA